MANMQHQQQVEGGGGARAAAEVEMSEEDPKSGDLGIAEAASPISSRPPAAPTANFEEMIRATADAGGGGSSSSNRWPRQETLALLQIRSEMDTAFRDATLKGPLWDQISRRLSALGYKRSGKKCKEKFENVHKYYKRTKEGRGGRQDGKSYKFFTQLEALHHNPTTTTTPAPLLPISASAAAAIAFPPPVMTQQDVASISFSLPPTDHNDPASAALFSITFSSDDTSSSSSSDGDDEETGVRVGDRRRKRKRNDGDGVGDERMMEFFEGLLKQVMQKQEAMQQRFLEAIEKREQDRMIRDEAWKRQDMARIAREHDLLAQERAVSASRDAAIIDFLQKITRQTIHLPTAVPRPDPAPQHQSEERQLPFDQPPPPPPPPPQPQPQPQPQNVQVAEAAAPTQQQMTTMPLQHLGGGEASSSRWPKAEVLQLIKIRSSMEARYQEAGPKGPLWEEISAGMKRIGYNRSAKRCKEKWENINKYFKKVKESNKKRPQDAKTCPYFDELDALYQRKIIGGGSMSFSEVERKQEQDVGMLLQPPQSLVMSNVSEAQASGVGAIASNPLGDDDSQTNIAGTETQPEDMLNKGQQQSREDTTVSYCNIDDDHDYEDEVEEYEDKTEEEMKMAYKIQFQRQDVGSSSGGGTSSFVAMVQ